jgi:oligosaccharide repeat unit polymerase
LTPEKIYFFQGNSYKKIYTKFIPRFIWEKKPRDEQGNFWGHRYLVLSPDDNTTSWNFPVLNEFYANYGMAGVIFGMFFLGFIIKLLILKLWTKNISDIEILISSIIIFNFFFLENNLSQILGKVINQFLFFNIFFIFIYLFFLFISKLKKTDSL